MRYATSLAATCLCSVAMSLPAPVSAQDFADDAPDRTSNRAGTVTSNILTSAKAHPPSIKLKQLNSQWRRFTISGDENKVNLNNHWMRMAMQMGLLERMGIGVYYTRGDTIKMGDQTYLVAYRIENQMDQQEMQEEIQEAFGHGHGDGGQMQGPVKFLPDTQLALSLLNLRSAGSLEDLRKFDPAREIMGPGEITAESTNNLRRLSQLLQQISRYQRLPLKDVRTMQESLQNQAHRRLPRLIVHPATKEPYRPNTKLAGKRSYQIANRREIVAIYEARPGTDGKRGVAFLDGRVERIPEANWAKVITVQPKGPNAQQIHAISAQNMQRLVRVLQRLGRSNRSFPDFSNAARTRQTLMNWGGYEPDLYVHPKTRQPYRVNVALSNKRLADITNQAQVVAIYESQPGSDGRIGAVFLDRRVERIDKARWKRVIAVAPKMKATAAPTTQRTRVIRRVFANAPAGF